ncbi:MAG: 6,7-dimethyl-8-ribityllumazine synthase [Bacteroidia bacterium]|nr:6,7-dimethyl-8-ribityllumazine synthase [Bacteroidia bacterium]
MKKADLAYTPPQALVERTRFFLLRTLWHADLTEAMEKEARLQLASFRFPEARIHTLLVAGAFELIHLSATIIRHYTWKRGFSQTVTVKGPVHIQSNLRLPPLFQGSFESQLRSEFALDSPGPIAYFQPYEPGPSDELPVIIAMGCILKGETEHNRYLAQAVIQQLAYLNAMSGIPLILGVLTPDTLRQAWERVSHAKDWVSAGFLLWESRIGFTSFFSTAPEEKVQT